MNEKNTIRSEIRAASRVTERTMETAIVRGDPSETRTARRIRAGRERRVVLVAAGRGFHARSGRALEPVQTDLSASHAGRRIDPEAVHRPERPAGSPLRGARTGHGRNGRSRRHGTDRRSGRSLRPARKPARARQGLLRPAASRAGSFESGRLFRLPDAGTHTLRSARRRHGLARVRIGPERRADRMPQAEKRNGPGTPERSPRPKADRPNGTSLSSARFLPQDGPKTKCRDSSEEPAPRCLRKSPSRSAFRTTPAGERDGLFPKNGYLCMSRLAQAAGRGLRGTERPQNDKTKTTWT